MDAHYVLEMKNITKTYGQNAVLQDVSIAIRPGEIHALLGENGAGKSTLMNILFGMPVIHSTGGFKGEVLMDGKPINIASPSDAMHKGIGMVHQEFMLIPGFTITENIKLNREITRPTPFSRIFGKDLEMLDEKAMAADARAALDSVGLGIEEYAMVKGLPVGYMQFVEIAREIDKRGVKLLVFDEPTAVLTESEAEQLLSVMRQIASRGIAIIFITHRLDEVMAAANHITVLRDGRFAAMRATQDTSLVELAELMIGRSNAAPTESAQRAQPLDAADIALKIRNLTVDMPGETACGVDLDVRKGEIFGIGGLAGQGKIGIPNGVMGLFPSQGEVAFFGEPLKLNDAQAALGRGLAMVSEDRRGVGLLLDQPIEDNIAFSAIQVHGRFLNNLLPKLPRFRLPKALIAGLCAVCVALFALGIYGLAQYQAAYDTSVWIKAYVAEQKALASKVTGGLAVVEESLEEALDDVAASDDAEVALPAEEPAAEEVIPEPDPDTVFLSERAYQSLSPAERRSLFFAQAAPWFLGAGFVLSALLFAYRIMTDSSMTQKKKRAIRTHAQRMIKELDIRCTSSTQRVGTLSGGNQQKVCIARALALDPKFLFVSEPTRGIDIGAKKLVLETLVRLNREHGLTIVMVSSELMELRSVCDRIAIVSEGRVVDVFAPDAPDADIGLAMSGIRQDKGGAA